MRRKAAGSPCGQEPRTKIPKRKQEVKTQKPGAQSTPTLTASHSGGQVTQITRATAEGFYRLWSPGLCGTLATGQNDSGPQGG